MINLYMAIFVLALELLVLYNTAVDAIHSRPLSIFLGKYLNKFHVHKLFG
jgi:hypothetical protein